MRFFILFFLTVVGAVCLAQEPLVIHEWGTFTSLQNEDGNAVPGINSDDEPVPPFVHQVNEDLLWGPGESKGVQRCHPDVTMRLETPVIYFHPAKETPLPITLDISAEFHGGWLSQFYPNAKCVTPGLGNKSVGHLKRDTVGTLAWDGLQVGASSPGPECDPDTWRVWTAPRKVEAAGVTMATPELKQKTESEKFLFYRGVGNLDAPIRVVREGKSLKLFGQLQPASPAPLRVQHLWLVDIRRTLHQHPDGSNNWTVTCAFRAVDPVVLGSSPKELLTTLPAAFEEKDYSAENLVLLKEKMHAGLVEDGLFADEAWALLNTWDYSYFKSGGLRLFFLVPREWTDRVLPLKVSVPAVISRTMVGRVEIVTPQQRELIQSIVNNPTNLKTAREAYYKLGRFAAALIIDEQKRQPLLKHFSKRADFEALDLVQTVK